MYDTNLGLLDAGKQAASGGGRSPVDGFGVGVCGWRGDSPRKRVRPPPLRLFRGRPGGRSVGVDQGEVVGIGRQARARAHATGWADGRTVAD